MYVYRDPLQCALFYWHNGSMYISLFAWFGMSHVKHSLVLSSGASPPTDVMAVQEGLTSIRVSWTRSSDATGYIISYTGGSSGSVTVSGGSTDERSLSNLVNGGVYTISIMATSTGLSSGSVVVTDVRLCKYHEKYHGYILHHTCIIHVHVVPGQPTINMNPTATATSISLSWSVPSGSVVTSYEVMWQRDTTVGCSDEDADSHTTADDSTTYVIRGLEEDSSYSITVRASNTAGSSEDSTVTGMTREAGERDAIAPPATPNIACAVYCSLQFLLPLPVLSVLLVHPLPSLSSGGWCHVSIVMER